MNRAINTSDLDLSVVEQLMQVQEPVALVTVVETKGSTPRGMGAMMYVYPDGRIVGSIGGGCSEAAILRDALDIIGTGTYKVIDIDMTGDVGGKRRHGLRRHHEGAGGGYPAGCIRRLKIPPGRLCCFPGEFYRAKANKCFM